jgi:fatty-acyl-CoA synthase
MPSEEIPAPAVDYSELKSLNIWQLLEHTAARWPEREALVSGPRRYNFREILGLVERCATGLAHHGLVKGDRVALIMPNWAEFIITYFAAARLGAILVPLNVRYRRHELEFMLRNSGAKLVVTCASFGDFNYIELLKEIQPNLPELAHIVVVGQSQGGPGLISWESVLNEASPASLPPVPLDPREDLFIILYTSGTTGQPKGVMLTHYNLVTNGLLMAEGLRSTEQDRYLVMVPLFHIFGISACVLAAYGSGACMVLLDLFKPEAALTLVETEQITVHNGVPTMFILELNYPNFSRFDLSSLRTGIIAAAPAPAEIIRRIRTEMNCDIASAYGLTETSPCLTMTRFEDDDRTRSETVGRALPGVEIKIMSDEGGEVPPGEVGELICRSSGVMKGYYKLPGATAAALDRDGWFYTGDLATLDPAGNIRIVGRKKEMINRGGFKVYPREVEDLYYAHPAVMEVAVLGVPDPVLGEKTLACIKLKPGQTAGAKELREFLRGKLADYKLPDFVRFVDEFPMTSSGKIKKVQLKEELSKVEIGEEN